MKIVISLIGLVFLAACSTSKTNKNYNRVELYYYQDATGQYVYKRENKKNKSRLINRIQLFDPENSKEALETSIIVSKLGRVGKSSALLPVISQYSIWFSKKKFFSQIKVNKKTKSLDITLKSPEKKWNGQKSIPFPSGKIFCFFNQLPECVKAHKLLVRKTKEQIPLTIIWDAYPYQTEIYEKINDSPFTTARFYLYEVTKREIKYALNLGNQVIFYHFNMELEFTKMFWIPQGISIKRQSLE